MAHRHPTVLRITSDVLRGNPLGDPHERDVWIDAPPHRGRAGLLHAARRQPGHRLDSDRSLRDASPYRFERSVPILVQALTRPEA